MTTSGNKELKEVTTACNKDYAKNVDIINDALSHPVSISRITEIR